MKDTDAVILDFLKNYPEVHRVQWNGNLFILFYNSLEHYTIEDFVLGSRMHTALEILYSELAVLENK